MGFPLVPKLVTLNDLEGLKGVMTAILRYSAAFGSFGANYVKVVEDRPILSAIKK